MAVQPQSETLSEICAGQHAPAFTLPDGRCLTDLRGHPVILAFSTPEWNPARAETMRVFNEIAGRIGPAGTRLLDLRSDGDWCELEFAGEATQNLPLWSGLDPQGEVAARYGVAGKNALFVLDEAGIVRWKIAAENGSGIRTGEVLNALESLGTQSPARNGLTPNGLSRRAFLSATLAAAAVLTLPLTSEARTNAQARSKTTQLQDDYPEPLSTGTVPVTLKVNGKATKLRIEPRVALLDALRENMGLTGTKKGCDHGQCGACTVHIDGQRALSCMTLAIMNEGREITTIEGLAQGDELHPMQQAFIKHDGFQCGYCTPGQIMSAVALLKEGRYQTDAELQEGMSGNLCRCAAYPNIIAAIKSARGA